MDASIKNLIQLAAKQLTQAKHAIALTGAGVSTESGIPDFRGPEGVWTKNPEAERRTYEIYPKFVRDPTAYWREMLTEPLTFFTDMEKAQPNPGHFALARLDQVGILKSTITQNIDGLHDKAGSKNLFEYHGSLLKMRCPVCNARYGRDRFNLEHLLKTNELPPLCTKCGNALKSDVVYFGEPIPQDVAEHSYREAQQCDVMLVCGTSAVVYPFASLPIIAAGGTFEDGIPIRYGREAATIIEINGEPTSLTREHVSSYLIAGKTGELLPMLADAVDKMTAARV
jgi:NAD-dependent deacetylase